MKTNFIFSNNMIREIIAYASVLGGFTVSNNDKYIRLFGYLLWSITNIYWFIDAYKYRKDNSQAKMWGLYIMSVILGLYYTVVMFI
jgi:hypothetical protein